MNVKRLILFCLLGGLLTTNIGCGLLQSVFCYRPCLSSGDCMPGVMGECRDEGCGPTCGPMDRPVRAPAYGARRARVVADCGGPCLGAPSRSCSPCDDPCMDPCGETCYGRCWHRGPLSCIFALLTPTSWWGPSCGERYWGDFYSDPPDCWDPCDGYGNYEGRGGYGCGCRNCADGYGVEGYGSGIPAYGNNVVSRSDRAVGPAPKLATRPHKAVRP